MGACRCPSPTTRADLGFCRTNQKKTKKNKTTGQSRGSTGKPPKHTHPAQALPPHEPAAHLTPVVLSSAAPVSVKEEGASSTASQIVKMEDMANSSVLMGGAGFAYIMRTGTATPGGSDMAGSLDETFDMPTYVPTLLPPRREDVPARLRIWVALLGRLFLAQI
jgi:hypothetical protein